MVVIDSPKLSQRYNFAVQHMMSAERFSQHCLHVENENIDQPFGPFFDEILSYVSATVFSTVAALEANINENFQDVQDGNIKIDGFNIQILKTLWSDIENWEILKKYNFFMELTTHERLDKSVCHYEFVKILIRARNALVHYKPEWQDKQKEHEKIGSRLINKFEFSSFLDESSPIFPMRCMTYNFAKWAVNSVLNFAEWFALSAGISNRFIGFTKHKNTKS